jgi:hypothetical protein
LSVLMRAAGELKERHDFERNATCAAAIVMITVTVCGIGTNLTARSGLARTGWQTGVCAGDFDNGGWDDLMLTYWSEQLYRTPPFVSAWMVEVGRLTCVPIFTSSSAATQSFSSAVRNFSIQNGLAGGSTWATPQTTAGIPSSISSHRQLLTLASSPPSNVPAHPDGYWDNVLTMGFEEICCFDQDFRKSAAVLGCKSVKS